MSHFGPAVPSEAIGVLTLGRRSLTFALGGLAYKGVALVSLPILARLLSPSELGLLDFAALLATIVGLTAALGSDQGVAYLEPRTDPSAGVWLSTLVIIGTIAGAFIVTTVLFGDRIAEWLTGDPADGRVIVGAALYGGVVALTTTALNAIRLHGSPRAYAVASFVIVTTEMAAALTIALSFESPVGLMVLAWAGGALVVVIPLLIRYTPSLDPPRVATIRQLAAYGAPLVPAAVAWLVGDAWIRAVIAQELGLGDLGQYGIAYRFGSVLILAVTGFGVAWQPYIFRSPPADVRERASSLLAYLILWLGFAGVVLTATAPEVIMLVAGDAYARAREAVGALSAGGVALGAFVLVAAVNGASGSTRRIGLAALTGVAVQSAAAPGLIGILGLAGAGLTSLMGYVIAVSVLFSGEHRLLGGLGGVIAAASVAIVASGLIVAGLLQDWPLGWRGLFVLGFAGIAATSSAVLRSWARKPAGPR